MGAAGGGKGGRRLQSVRPSKAERRAEKSVPPIRRVNHHTPAERNGACAASALAKLSGAVRISRCALIRAGSAAVQPAPTQPVGRRPQAGRLFGEPAEWRPAAGWSSGGEQRHEAASGARPAGLGGPGGAGGGGRVGTA